MAIDIDGFGLLRDIGANATVFAGLDKDVAKAARMLVVKHIKDNSSSLTVLRHVKNAIGPTAFALIMDGMSEAQIKSIVAKLDKYHPELKTATPDWRRRHLFSLAEATMEPFAKPTSAPRLKKTKLAAPSDGAERISFSSAGATRKR
jgi:hypothetical protein